MSKSALDATKRKYFPELQYLRGFAILAMLLTHMYPDAAQSSPALLYCMRFCACASMVLFFGVSGLLAAPGLLRRDGFWAECKKKLRHLMLPYFTHSLISYALKLMTEGYANNGFAAGDLWKILIGVNPNGGLWFLWTLMVIWLAASALVKPGGRIWPFLIVCLLAHAASVIFDLGEMHRLAFYGAFYALGALLSPHYESFRDRLSRRPAVCALCLIGSAAVIAAPEFYPLALIHFALTFTAGVGLSCFFQGADAANPVRRALLLLGDYSYDIYLLSYYTVVAARVLFWTILGWPYPLVVALMFAAGLFPPLLLSGRFLRKSPLLSLCLLGRPADPKRGSAG